MNRYLLSGLVLSIFAWLFVGSYTDPEFHNWTLFVKHKASTKVRFYSPIGESDMTLKDLRIEDAKEEIAFDEFVTKQRTHVLFERLGFLACLTILTIIVLLTIGIKSLLKPQKIIKYVNSKPT